MAFTNIGTYLKPGIGYYSQDIIPYANSFIGDILFGIADPSEPGSRFRKKQILLENTTVEDGVTLKWGLDKYASNADVLSAAATAGDTTITVNDGSVFNVGDDILIGNPASGTEERKYVAAIAGNTVTLDSALANAHNVGEPVKRINHAKAEKQISDSKVSGRTREEATNFIQTFDVDLTIENRDLNKHILEVVRPFSNISDALKNRDVKETLANYLAKVVYNAIDNRLISDIERALWFGIKNQVNVNGTRYFTGGYETHKTEEITQDVSTFTDDKQFFDYIWKIVYDVENEAQKIKATDITIVMNNAMFKRFMTLQPNAVQYPAEPDASGYRMTKLFINNRSYNIYFSPVVDEVYDNPTVGVMYIFPKDSIAGKTLEWVDADFDGKKVTPKRKSPMDLKVVMDPTSEATGDAKTWYILYQLGFVFGGYTPSKPVNVYRKAVFSNV